MTQSKKHKYIQDNRNADLELEAFLDQHQDVEKYYQDGQCHYFVVPHSYFDMGTSGQLPIGDQIYSKFPHYDVYSVYQPGGHSGYVWRQCFWVVGGNKHRIGKRYDCDWKETSDELYLGGHYSKFTRCEICDGEQACSNQHGKKLKDRNINYICNKCFNENFSLQKKPGAQTSIDSNGLEWIKVGDAEIKEK